LAYNRVCAEKEERRKIEEEREARKAEVKSID